MLKFTLPLTPTPNTSRWNIGGLGSLTQGAGVGHVHSMYLSCFFVLMFGYPTQTHFQWNMGLNTKYDVLWYLVYI